MLLFAVVSMAQNKITVSGVVTDKTGETVIGASVRVKGQENMGTITDIDGKYQIPGVPANATLIFSYIGMKEQEVALNGRSTVNLMMEEDSQLIEEVVVVGYGSAKKRDLTGSIVTVKAAEIASKPSTNPLASIQGKVAGVQVINTGRAGQDPEIRVRGTNSINGYTPLYVVDGLFTDNINYLNTADIESMEILKDPSSLAIFGVRGANGVILVTTKRGQEGKPKINVSTSYSLQMPTRMPEFANSYEYASTYVNAQRRDGIESNFAFTDEAIEAYRTHSNPLAYPDTDWVDMLIKDVALQTQHNFSISGGTRGVRYFASLGVLTQDGLFKSFEKEYDGNFKYNRYNYRINLDLDLTKTTLMRMNLGGRVNDKRTPNYEGSSDIGLLFRDIYWAIPMSGVGIMDGKWIWPDTKEFSLPGTVRDGLYPYYGKGYNTSAGNILNFDFMLEQKLNFITKGLKAHVKASYNSGVTLKKLRKTSYPHYELSLIHI